MLRSFRIVEAHEEEFYLYDTELKQISLSTWCDMSELEFDVIEIGVT